MARGTGMEEYMDPIPVDPGFLSDDEMNFYSAHAGEVNFMMQKVVEGGFRGETLAEFSIYFFKLGRDYASKGSSE